MESLVRNSYFNGKKIMELVNNPELSKKRMQSLTMLLEEDAATYRDIDVKASRVTMNSRGNILLAPKSGLKKSDYEELEPTRWAAQQFGAAMEIPQKYTGLLYDTDKEVLAYNINKRKQFIEKQNKDKKPTYYFLRNVIQPNGKQKCRAFLSNQYTPMDNVDVHYMLMEVSNKIHAVPQSWSVTEEMFNTRYVVPEMCFTIQNGTKEDKYFMFYNVWNSEVGQSAVWLDAGSWRLVCTNGLMHKETSGDEYRQVHKGGSTILYKMDIEKYLSDQYKKVLAQKEMLQDSVAIKIADMQDEINKIVKKYELREKDKKAINEAFLVEPYNSAYGLVNAITRAAQQENNLLKRNEIETKAGVILLDLVS